MFENLFVDAGTIARHHNGPLLDERHRYLLHGAAVGATLHTQRNRARALLWIAKALPTRAYGQVDVVQLRQLIAAHQPPVSHQTPRWPPKLPHLWPVKLLHLGGYDLTH